MRKFLFAATVLALSSCTAPAYAASCQPLAEVGSQLMESGITRDQVFATDDLSFVSVYHKEAGITLPDDVEPIGMIVVERAEFAAVGLVENRGGMCIRYVTRVQIDTHKRAFATAKGEA